MGEKIILLLCYTEGQILHGSNGICYSKPLWKGITFQEGRGLDELKRRLKDELDTLGEAGELEITYRCPATGPSNSSRFVPLLLQNDNHVKFMTTIATHSQVPSCVELYIKRFQTIGLQIPTINLNGKLDAQASELLSPRNWHWQNPQKEFPKWMNVLAHTNKGTQVQWDLTGTSGDYRFKRLFWSFGAAIEGFAYCRPFIQVDGIKLPRSRDNGTLLFATSVDSNGHIYPLAFAIVEEESDDSWSWFLRILRTRVTQRDGICLISNLHKGILSVVNDPSSGWKEPKAYHRLCLQHVTTNFDRKDKKKDLKDLMYRAGCQHQKHKYEQCMNELKQLSPVCLKYFIDISKEKWTQSYDNGYRYGWMTTNLDECMKDILEGVSISNLSIDEIVKLTFHRSLCTFEERRIETHAASGRGEVYTKYAMEKISKWKERASSHTVVTLDNMNENFEVVTGGHGSTLSKGHNKQMVRLQDKTCTCNKWQSFGIPCSHVIAVCLHCNIDYWRFVEDYYELTVYQSCYNPSLHPIPPGYCLSPLDLIIVHPTGYVLGQRSLMGTSRTHYELDRANVIANTRCGLCKRAGHNIRFCPSQNKGASSCTNYKS